MSNENVINLSELQIDKENSSVSYNEENHKYWTRDAFQECISVTTLIHQFSTFDEDFWSSYKALEALVSENDFKGVKMDLLNTKRFSLEYLKQLNISEDFFNEKKSEILKEWARKRDESCARGTAIHKFHELEHLSGRTQELQKLSLGGNFVTKTTNKIELGKQGVYPEILLSRISPDGKLRIAGQADLVIVDGNDVYVQDYKTNKSIDQKSYFDRKTKKSQMMKYPLNNIQDSNFWHYSLQLSTYAWMIEKEYPEVNIKSLTLIHYDHEGGCTFYDCKYLKEDVERMLLFYRKQVEYNEFKKSREKVIF